MVGRRCSVVAKKTTLWQATVRDAVVVTAEYAGGACETWVMGGQLDGWVVPSKCRRDAEAVHRGAVRMARESHDSGVSVRREAEVLN